MVDVLVPLFRFDAQSHIPEVDDVRLRRANVFEKSAVMAWVERVFDADGWRDEVAASFLGRPPNCFVAVERGGLIGFLCYDTTFRGFVGPGGVTPDARGRGVFSALLAVVFRAMWFEGHAYAIVGAVAPETLRLLSKRFDGAVVLTGSEPGPYGYGFT